MKCPDCGTNSVQTKKVKKEGTVYTCPDCSKGFEYTSGKPIKKETHTQ